MSENLPACKYWHTAAVTGGAALNRQRTTGLNASRHLPTPRLPASHPQRVSAGQGGRKDTPIPPGPPSPAGRVLCVVGTPLRSWAAPAQVSPSSVAQVFLSAPSGSSLSTPVAVVQFMLEDTSENRAFSSILPVPRGGGAGLPKAGPVPPAELAAWGTGLGPALAGPKEPWPW